MINPQWLELPMSRMNFHGPKGVRAIEVLLYICSEAVILMLFVLCVALWLLAAGFLCTMSYPVRIYVSCLTM